MRSPLLIYLFLAFNLFPTLAQEESPNLILITNVNVWDGNSTSLEKADVLIENNLIKQVSANISAPDGSSTIDGNGGTLMPGLIEGHGHLQMNGTSIGDIENNRNWEELAVRSVVNAENEIGGRVFERYRTRIPKGTARCGMF